MAHAQPRYGIAPNSAHGQTDPSYHRQPHQDDAAYEPGRGYQNHETYHEPAFNGTLYRLGEHHASGDRTGMRAGGNGYYGGTVPNGNMRQGGGYEGAAAPPSQQKADYNQRYAYQEHQAHPPLQMTHRPPVDVHGSPPTDIDPQNAGRFGAHRPRAQQNGHRQEAARADRSMHADVGYHRSDQYYEPRGDRGHRPQPPRIATSRSADAIRRPPQPALQSQRQEHSNSYGSGAIQPSNGNHMHALKPASSHGQRQPTPPKLAAAQVPKPKERILADLTLPDTISWDNPFPTFPNTKKKASQANGDNLNTAAAGMNLQDDSRRDQTHEQRPSTANSNGSKSSSFSTGRKPNTRQMQDYPDQRTQPTWDGHEERNGGIHNAYNETHSNSQSNVYQYENAAYKVPKHQQNAREEWPITQHIQPPISGRRSEDANALSSSSPPHTGFMPEPQRSNTMPNNVAEVISSLGPLPRCAEPSWQEPGPNAGYYGLSDKEYLPNSPRRTKASRARPADHPKSEAGIYSPIQGNPYQTPSSAHPTPYSAQYSIGDLFDSYYDSSHHDQGSYGRSRERHLQTEIDEDMPNFDAIPDSNTGHRRGLTIDEHLESQYVAPAVPPMPAQYREANAGYTRPSPNSPGQVPRSRSSPNLKEPRSPGSAHHPGFDFDMPGMVRAMPTKPLPRDSSDRPSNFSANLCSPQQTYGQHAGSHKDQRPGPSASRWPGDGANAYRPLPRTPQERTPNGHQQPPAMQNIRPSTDQGKNPNSRGGHPSQPTTESRPASAPSNPDALPRHPAPIRPGLIPDSSVHQAPKLAPIRQYDNGSSSRQQARPIQPPDPSARASADKRQNSVIVTHEELEGLRQTVARSPSDQKTQLILAKKMVEAASVLIDQRADQRTKAKMREKYILDAHKIVKKLVNSGYADASFYLADCYSRGFLGLETDPKEAFNLYQSAAKAGHPQAAYRVAVCCEMGQEEGGGTRRDPLKAMQWYKRAATLGDTPAMYKMGIIQLKGLLGQPKNPNQAVTWLKRAADKADEENPHALHELGLLHEKDGGNEGVIKDELYSKQLFTQAAKLGYKFSQFRLGCAYEYGLMGCQVDPRRSIAWYSKAAVQEEHQSELALSGWYLTGSEGVLQQSDTEAYLWARKAAQAGLAKAEYAMGYFTEVGIGAPANLEDAKRWYWRAASQNFPKARDRLEDLRKGGAKMEKSRVSRSAVNKQTEGECVVM